MWLYGCLKRSLNERSVLLIWLWNSTGKSSSSKPSVKPCLLRENGDWCPSWLLQICSEESWCICAQQPGSFRDAIWGHSQTSRCRWGHACGGICLLIFGLRPQHQGAWLGSNWKNSKCTVSTWTSFESFTPASYFKKVDATWALFERNLFFCAIVVKVVLFCQYRDAISVSSTGPTALTFWSLAKICRCGWIFWPKAIKAVRLGYLPSFVNS